MGHDRWCRLLCLFISFAFVFSCAPSVNRADSEEIEYYSVTDDLQFEVNAQIVSSWDTHANLQFDITNTGNEIIHNWFFTFEFPNAIEGIWNASVLETNGTGTYTIRNTGSNQDILPGNSVSFGMTVSSLNGQPVETLPSYYLLNTCVETVPSSDYSLTYQEYSNWGTGFNGALILSNTSSLAIEDWQLSFSCNRGITEVSGANLTTSDDLYVVSNDGANQNINVGSYINMTIVGNALNCSTPLVLSSVILWTVKCAYSIFEDLDSNGVADYLDFINGVNGGSDLTPTPTETPTPTPAITEVPTPEPTPTPEPIIDSDGDGIPDYYELQLGTDPDSDDSDNDGISDSIEWLLGMDLLSDDSDGDGITDSQEDDDSDGLTLGIELEIGTDPFNSDTDDDDLSDYEEYYVYGTDPLKYDTDGDHLEDSEEIKMGSDPLNPDTDNDGIPDDQERFLQTRTEMIHDEERPAVTRIDVVLEGTGCLDSVMEISSLNHSDFYTEDLVGLVGAPIEIEYEGDFDEAMVTFHYDEALLSSNDFNDPEECPFADDYAFNPNSLGILYFDEENGMYVECESTVDTVNHTVSFNTTHFSTYSLVDMRLWYFWWSSLKSAGELRPSHEGYEGIDYVLEIPCLQSMTQEDIDEMNAIAHRIIDNKGEYDRMAICGYNSYSGTYPYFFTVHNSILSQQLDEWPWDDSGNWVGWTGSAGNMLGYSLSANQLYNVGRSMPGHHSSRELVVIAFNNSNDINCTFYDADIKAANSMSAYIFTLSSGNPNTANMNWLNLTSGGGVIDCQGKTAEEVYDRFAELYELHQGTDDDLNDVNVKIGDGLWDVVEEQGMIVANGHVYFSNPEVFDTDDDNLTDYKEMGERVVVEVTEGEKFYVNGVDDDSLPTTTWQAFCRFLDYGVGTWYFYKVKSNPMVEDSDFDGANDNEDARPLQRNKDIAYILYDASEDADWYLKREADIRRDMFEDVSKVEAIPVKQPDKDKPPLLREEWNKLGENSDGKILYNIIEVAIVFHGLADSIDEIDTSQISWVDEITPYNNSDGWKKKKIQTLILSSCHSGELGVANNPAYTFMNSGTIGEVYAWHGTAAFLGGSSSHWVIKPGNPIPQIGEPVAFGIPLDIMYTWEFSPSGYEMILNHAADIILGWIYRDKNLIGYGEVGMVTDLILLHQYGRYRYYRNKRGEVLYEKVSDSSLSVIYYLWSS
ncbi:MAG: cellulose binding domain-containing protein [Clostridiales bacterium]|nr:cellulose binding domain-containing protein [Clostridiales bacterium]